MRFKRYNVQAVSFRLVALGALLAALSALLVGADARAAFSGTNGLVAYTCGSNVCVVNPGSSGGTTLITGATDPVWSPDGTKLAYVTSTNGIDVQGVSNGALTGAITHVTAGPATQPTWSSTGSRIAYVNSTASTIYVANADGTGGATAVLSSPSGTEVDPAWSPTGTQLAFVRPDGSSHDQIFTVALSGTGVESSAPVALTNSTGDNRHPTWSPNGSTIAFSSTRDAAGYALLYSMTSSGGSQTKLGSTSAGIGGDMPSYSPDSTTLAYVVSASATDGTPGNVRKVAASGSGSSTTIDSGTTNADPDWQATTSSSSGGSSSTAPTNTSYPTVVLSFGTTSPQVGGFVSANVGSWSGQSPITYTYQWKKCAGNDPLSGTCTNIAGATSSFLTVPADAYGMRLRVQVTAKNSLGSTSQNSEATDIVGETAVHLSVTPQIQGTNVVDQALSLTAGTWTGTTPITFTYSWRRCNPAGDLPSCVPIAGATASTYTLKTADIGSTIRVWITGTNLAGSDVAITNHLFPVVDKQHFKPSATTMPTIAGTLQLGRQLTGDAGVFAGDAPVTKTLQWQRCDATGADCHNIVGAVNVVYNPGIADLGSTLRLAVTAKNGYGTLVALSAATDPVMGAPPHRRGRHLVGTAKSDYLAGGGYDDVIEGRGGNDTLLGGAGDDRIDGGPGNDVIVGGAGADRLYGGPGSDTILAADGERDIVDCGAGKDRAVVDAVDIVRKNCEVVQVSTPQTSGSGSGSDSGSGSGSDTGGATGGSSSS